MNNELISELMKNPKIIDEELAKVLGKTRSAVTKQRQKLEKNKELNFYASPKLIGRGIPLTSGILKFRPAIGMKDLRPFAEDLSKDKQFLTIFIRKTSQMNYGIGFWALLEDNTMETSQKFNENLKEKTYKQFLGDWIGMDVASGTHIVKLMGQKVPVDEYYK